MTNNELDDDADARYAEHDADSALGDDDAQSTVSLTSSVYNYKYEHGRRYHAYHEGSYYMPNDEQEIDRLDAQHEAFRLTMDGALYCAPISQNAREVLDVGCGTGIWSVDFADEYPSSAVLGTDLSPIQPTSSVPPNCSFLIDDAESEWLYRQRFDFIHTRAMFMGFKNWPNFMAQSFAHLQPGGWLECQDFFFPPVCFNQPGLPVSSSPYLQWADNLTKAAAMRNADLTAPGRLGSMMAEVGFTDIHLKKFKWPLTPWAKGDKMQLLGRLVKQDFDDVIQGSSLRLFTIALGWTVQEVEVFLASVRREMKEMKNVFYQPMYVWYARKPYRDENVIQRDPVIEDMDADIEDAHPSDRNRAASRLIPDIEPGIEKVGDQLRDQTSDQPPRPT